MRTRYVRTRPGRRESFGAASVSLVLATGVGLATFYLTRLFLSREPIGRQEREASPEAADVAE